MATTSLRIYLHDIEGLVDAGQTDEAIAHCRHILQTFPKSIAVYRLLGKAYLESQRYSDAADVLQRVLSAVPDDFISHVGMSIIREDEGNLDAAIWHMERAFEGQPYNTAIQDELRRLYGRRDGMEPPKMRLTRGALARMYMRGNLHQQAIGELRAALAEDSQRPDLQALLARVYYMAGQRVEAVETCSSLLKKLPYCLDANILLGAILPETERAQDAQNYRQRAISLEPYFAQAPSNAQTADQVPSNAVNVEKLNYSPDKAAGSVEEQPAWATSLGVAFNEPKESETIPDWLSAASESGAKQGDQSDVKNESPFGEAKAADTFPWEPPSTEAAPSAAQPTDAESIPDWMKEAGWKPSSGTVQEGPLSFDQAEETLPPATGDLAPAEIPDWLRQAAPPGILDQIPPAAPTEEKPLLDDLPWLQETPPGSSDTIATWLNETKPEVPHSTIESTPPAEAAATAEISELGEIPDWLQTAKPAEAAPETGAAPETQTAPETGAVTEEDLPDWLKEAEVSTRHDTGELPAWLQANAAIPTESSQPAAPVETSSPEKEIIKETPQDAGTPAEEFPDWLKEVEAEIPDEAVETPQLKGVTEWLQTVNTGDLNTGSIGITDWLNNVEPGAQSATSEAEAAPADDVPDWLKGIIAAKETETSAETAKPAAPSDEVPEWLNAPEEQTPTAISSTTQAATPTPVESGLPAGLDLSDQDAALAWLEGLAAKQGVPEAELISKPEERAAQPPTSELEAPELTPAIQAEEVPDWLKAVEAEIPEEAAPTAEVTPAVEAGEVPDWLKAVDAEIPEEAAPTAEVTPAVKAEEVPDWLKAVEAEIPEEAIPPAQVAPIEAAPAAEGGLPAGLDLSDQDAALAWLEGLAAKQGVPEAELISKPEERAALPPTSELEAPELAPAVEAEEVPDWLKAVEAEIPEEAAPTAQVSPTEVTPAAEAEEVPDWLKAVEAEIPEEAAPTAEVTPAVAAEEVPDWLKEVEIPEEAIPPAQVAPIEAAPAAEGGLPAGLDLSDQDAALAWLEGLAAKQGVPEAELISKPEERAAQPPTSELEAPELTPAVQAEEVPDWLKAVEAEIPEEAVPTAEVTPAVAAEEVPDWLKEVEAEIPEEAAPTAQVSPTEVTPAVEGGLPAGLDLSDQDAALAWLEGLAAKQGVPEAELISKPEERAALPPTWEQETPEPTPAIEAEEVPDWLKAVEAEIPEEAAPTAEVTPAVDAEEVPDWLKEVEGEIPEEAAPTAQVTHAVEAEEVPDWLRTVAEEMPQTTLLEQQPSAGQETELEATASEETAAAQAIPTPAAEWIKETELSEWEEKAEAPKKKTEEKPEAEIELPGWIAEAAAQDHEPAWVPPQIPEKEEKPARALTNLNSASVGELERLPGIGFVLAQSIINHRDARGPFTHIDQLLDVPGLGQGTIDVLRAWITVEPVADKVSMEMGTAPLDPDHLILRKAQKALQQGDTSGAVKQYEMLLKKLVLLNEIILDLQDALYRYPVDISVWQALGDAYMRNNQLQDALDAYTKAEELLR